MHINNVIVVYVYVYVCGDACQQCNVKLQYQHYKLHLGTDFSEFMHHPALDRRPSLYCHNALPTGI